MFCFHREDVLLLHVFRSDILHGEDLILCEQHQVVVIFTLPKKNSISGPQVLVFYRCDTYMR